MALERQVLTILVYLFQLSPFVAIVFCTKIKTYHMTSEKNELPLKT